MWTRDDDSFLFLDCCCSAVLKIAEPELQSFKNFFFFLNSEGDMNLWEMFVPTFHSALVCKSCSVFLASSVSCWESCQSPLVDLWGDNASPISKLMGLFNLSLFADVICRRLWASNIVIRPFQVSWICFCISTNCYWLRKSHKITFSFSDFRDNKQYLMESLIQDDKNVLCLVYSRGYLRGI